MSTTIGEMRQLTSIWSFRLERLLELEAAGIIGLVADTHYGFGFVQDPRDLLAPGRKVGRLLAQAQVDLVILVPA